MMWGIRPTKHYYDIFTVKLDGSDGRFKGQVVIPEFYGLPQAIPEDSRQDIAVLIGTSQLEISFVVRAFEGYVEIWDSALALTTHRLRKSMRVYADEDTELLTVPEKECPQCGLKASQGSFVRGSLLCRVHNYLFGGC